MIKPLVVQCKTSGMKEKCPKQNLEMRKKLITSVRIRENFSEEGILGFSGIEQYGKFGELK